MQENSSKYSSYNKKYNNSNRPTTKLVINKNKGTMETKNTNVSNKSNLSNQIKSSSRSSNNQSLNNSNQYIDKSNASVYTDTDNHNINLSEIYYTDRNQNDKNQSNEKDEQSISKISLHKDSEIKTQTQSEFRSPTKINFDFLKDTLKNNISSIVEKHNQFKDKVITNFENKNQNECIKILNSLVKNLEESNDESLANNIIDYYYQLAACQVKKNDRDKAKKNLKLQEYNVKKQFDQNVERAIEYKDMGPIETVLNNYYKLSNLYDQIGDQKKACKYLYENIETARNIDILYFNNDSEVLNDELYLNNQKVQLQQIDLTMINIKYEDFSSFNIYQKELRKFIKENDFPLQEEIYLLYELIGDKQVEMQDNDSFKPNDAAKTEQDSPSKLIYTNQSSTNQPSTIDSLIKDKVYNSVDINRVDNDVSSIDNFIDQLYTNIMNPEDKIISDTEKKVKEKKKLMESYQIKELKPPLSIALKQFNKALQVLLSFEEKFQTNIAEIMFKISMIYLEINDISEALQFSYESLKIRRTTLEEYHPDNIKAVLHMKRCVDTGLKQNLTKIKIKKQNDINFKRKLGDDEVSLADSMIQMNNFSDMEKYVDTLRTRYDQFFDDEKNSDRESEKINESIPIESNPVKSEELSRKETFKALNEQYKNNNIDQRFCNSCLIVQNVDELNKIEQEPGVELQICKNCEKQIDEKKNNIAFKEANTSFLKDNKKKLQNDLDHLVDDFKDKFAKLTQISPFQMDISKEDISEISSDESNKPIGNRGMVNEDSDTSTIDIKLDRLLVKNDSNLNKNIIQDAEDKSKSVEKVRSYRKTIHQLSDEEFLKKIDEKQEQKRARYDTHSEDMRKSSERPTKMLADENLVPQKESIKSDNIKINNEESNNNPANFNSNNKENTNPINSDSNPTSNPIDKPQSILTEHTPTDAILQQQPTQTDLSSTSTAIPIESETKLQSNFTSFKLRDDSSSGKINLNNHDEETKRKLTMPSFNSDDSYNIDAMMNQQRRSVRKEMTVDEVKLIDMIRVQYDRDELYNELIEKICDHQDENFAKRSGNDYENQKQDTMQFNQELSYQKILDFITNDNSQSKPMQFDNFQMMVSQQFFGDTKYQKSIFLLTLMKYKSIENASSIKEVLSSANFDHEQIDYDLIKQAAIILSCSLYEIRIKPNELNIVTIEHEQAEEDDHKNIMIWVWSGKKQFLVDLNIEAEYKRFLFQLESINEVLEENKSYQGLSDDRKGSIHKRRNKALMHTDSERKIKDVLENNKEDIDKIDQIFLNNKK